MTLQPSSPRLPSPPPPTEIQIGPKSPSLGSSNSQEPSIEQSVIDANAERRIHPGTKSADMAAGPPLMPLSELDSAFQLQEHLKALHYHYTKPTNNDNTIPINRESAILIAAQPDGVERALWLYELCRFLINKCNDLIIGFLFDDPPCSATTCPEMRASEWQFLCAVHESPKSCCAIDYCCHTLDWATNIVTSQKIFPSRLSLGAGDAIDERGAGVKHLINIFRRLHRIFAHAWFQHRGVFWQVEGQTGLYVLFKTVCDSYDLLPAENYKLPPEAEGLEPADEPKAAVPSIMKSGANNHLSATEDDFVGGLSRANTTRRHVRQSPSVGSAVHTVLEADEEDPDVTQKLQELDLEDEEREADVPVIVETYEMDEKHDAPVEPEEKSEPEPETSPEPADEEHEQKQAEQDDAAVSMVSGDKIFSESLEDTPSTDDNKGVEVNEKSEEEQPEETHEAEPSKVPETKNTAPLTADFISGLPMMPLLGVPQEVTSEAQESGDKEFEERRGVKRQ
ncbi:MOB kinase activator-like [Lachnellula suecica]|uniref:MOB kinase activator-like n=1 Tax=Lachnellula suecica TaxID=602035 RepID=A0A8T9CLL9_9HELO|nr:MOB kinase activator-like [Lachnellula suecica]